MKTRPILFSALMVRALLNGTKTQTRRIVKPQESIHGPCQSGGLFWIPPDMQGDPEPNCPTVRAVDRCPYGQPGDRLWVKETWNTSAQWQGRKPTDIPEGVPIFFAADYSAAGCETCKPWHPSLFMRQWMSRITLEIVSVRVERLQSISKEDAVAEGLETTEPGMFKSYDSKLGWLAVDDARLSYRTLWESINGEGSWDANPWVWVVEFRRVKT
jgi:hypothetical protein